MNADTWVALAVGLCTVAGMILAATWRMSSQFTQAVTTFHVTDQTRAGDIARLSTAIERLDLTVAGIAADRATATALERRVSRLEQWYDELRRGDGIITARNSGT